MSRIIKTIEGKVSWQNPDNFQQI